MSKEHDTLREAWRIGYRKPDGFTIPANSAAHAARIRFALYNATRAARKDPRSVDDGLRLAIENCQITITDASVVIQRKVSTDISQLIARELGREVMSVEEYEQEASLARLMEKIQAAPPAPDPATLATPTASQIQATNYGARRV